MRVTYVTRSFLDYRIPVLEAINRKLDGGFSIIYSADYVPARVHARIGQSLGERAIGMRGERRIGPNEFPDFANTAFRIVYQPGLMGAIRATAPDVLVGDGFFQWTTFALLYKLRYRAPLVICYERTQHTERRAQGLRVAYRRAVLKLIDAVSCNGALSLEYTRSLGMDGTKITTGHMVADTDGLREKAATVSRAERDAIRGRWGTPEVAFLAVGRLNERKGIRELLAAWALLERRNPGPWRLVLVGAGDDGDALRRQAQDLGLSGVTFHGPADYDEIARFYAAADVLVMPTLEDNWSLVVPEAMACGLPVLCSIYNGCHPELVAPGFNGWTFDPLAVEDTLRGLATALENRARLPEMGRASLAIVARHTPEHAADAILGACRIALANRQGDGHARLARP